MHGHEFSSPLPLALSHFLPALWGWGLRRSAWAGALPWTG